MAEIYNKSLLYGTGQALSMVPRAGLEPATLSLEVSCSIQLSYRGTVGLLSQKAGIFSRGWVASAGEVTNLPVAGGLRDRVLAEGNRGCWCLFRR